MASQTFTPTNTVDMSKERDWAANIGMMDWDSTNIVFTKRSLIEFLKYTGTTVDTNFSNISKMPRYAKFGKISENPAPADADGASVGLEASAPESASKEGSGGLSSGLFEEEFGDDALSQAPPKSKTSAEASATAVPAKVDAADDFGQTHNGPRPSRRVRTAPGGKDSLTDLWGSADVEKTEFKPTRRVRQGPGGRDSIGDLLG